MVNYVLPHRLVPRYSKYPPGPSQYYRLYSLWCNLHLCDYSATTSLHFSIAVTHFRSFSGRTDYFLFCTPTGAHKMVIIIIYFSFSPFSIPGSPRKRSRLIHTRIQVPSRVPDTWLGFTQQTRIALNSSLNLFIFFCLVTCDYSTGQCCAMVRKKQPQHQPITWLWTRVNWLTLSSSMGCWLQDKEALSQSVQDLPGSVSHTAGFNPLLSQETKLDQLSQEMNLSGHKSWKNSGKSILTLTMYPQGIKTLFLLFQPF